MATFCLIPKVADKFIEKLKSGEFDPVKLAQMSSEERRTAFGDVVGEANAPKVNELFESKLLLKNQQTGMINWAKQLTGLKPEVQRDIVSRINKLDTLLNPKDEKAFLQDLAAHKLGATVTLGEAAKISELAKNVQETKAQMETGGDRLNYGKAQVEFGNYLSELKNGRTIGEMVKDVPGMTKAIKASMDNSAIFRQGWKTLFTNPQIWAKNALQSFKDIVQTFGGKQVLDEVKADILSRPNADLYKTAKLATATIEEDFPTSLPEKIPLLGRAYKASEVAYTAFLHRMRADVFDKYIDIAKKTDVTLDDTQLQSIGKLVNSLTGRGNLGKLEPVANVVNNVFFSPRKLKADLDFLTAHQFQKDVTPFVRKQAAMNLAKVVTGTAGILAIANAISPGSVEKDPRSSDFGKIRIGDTRFDVTGGMSSILTLAARELTQASKSSTTGKVTPLNAKDKKGNPRFGAQTGMDVLVNFGEGKLSPIISVVKDLMKGQDFSGKPITVGGEAQNLLVPLPITTYEELKNNPKSANILLSMIADSLGISVNTYSKKK